MHFLRDNKENSSLVDRVAIVAEAARFASSLEHNSGDIKALWSKHTRYIYYICTL